MTRLTVQDIADSLYMEQPPDGLPLFHYTSLKGLLGVVESKSLHATDVHFFSDASEIKRTANLLREAIGMAPIRRPRQQGLCTGVAPYYFILLPRA
jgi:hypothetical protein